MGGLGRQWCGRHNVALVGHPVGREIGSGVGLTCVRKFVGEKVVAVLGRGGCRLCRCALREDLVHAIHEHLGLERLGDVSGCLYLVCACLVEGFECPGQQQHRCIREVGVIPNSRANFVAALSGHDDVGEDDVRVALTRAGYGVVAVVHAYNFNVLVDEAQSYELLNHDTVVSEQQCSRHFISHEFRDHRTRIVRFVRRRKGSH